MLARCARCQGTFTTDRYGRQTCPHCGSELILPAPPGTPEPEAPPPAPGEPAPPASSAPPPGAAGGGAALPPPPGPPSGGYGPPPGWGPPPSQGGWGAPPPPGRGWGAAPPPEGPPAPSPFAERARLGFFPAFFETWRLVATQPQQFFGRVRLDQTGTALLFGVIAATFGNLVAALYAWLSGQQAATAMQPMLQGLPEEQARFFRLYLEAMSGGWILGQVLLTPVIVLVGTYVGAAVLHLLLLLFRGAHRGFDATLTVVAFVNGLNLLLAVPGCGGLLAVVWSMVSLILGLAAVHRTGAGRTTAAVLAPLLLALVCCCGAAGIGLPALLKGAQEAGKQTEQTHL